ncbi:capsid cement protein [Dermabacteraceae bacterium P7006]
MATNQVHQPGVHISLPVAAGVKSGDPVRVGVLNGVAVTGRGEGGNPEGNASVWLDGIWALQVKGAVTNVGDIVYITDAREITTTKGSNKPFGAALDTQSGDGVVPVKIIQGHTA